MTSMASARGAAQHSVLPSTRVKRISDSHTAAGDLPEGANALRVTDAGELYEPPGYFSAFEKMGTTPTLLLAEALKKFSRLCKGMLLLHLSHVPSAAELLDELTGAYAAKHGSCAVAATSAEQGFDDIAGGGAGVEDQAAATGVERGTPFLRREPFETAIAAYWLFEKKPQEYGWVSGSEEHVQSVLALRAIVRKVLEAAVPGPWAAGGGDDWLQSSGESGRSMLDDEMDILMLECCEALSLRRLRNESVAHPFSNPDASARVRSLELLELVIASNLSEVEKVPRLAQAAAQHVQQELQEIANQQQAMHMPAVRVRRVDT